jgi:hypothetical protein
VGEGRTNNLQKRLTEKIAELAKKCGDKPVPIEELLNEVATTERGESLQAAALELFDRLQWGELELTGAGVTRVQPSGSPVAQEDLQLDYMSQGLRDDRNGRDQEEAHASGVRRRESRIDRDRILQSWAFRRLEGVTQCHSPR